MTNEEIALYGMLKALLKEKKELKRKYDNGEYEKSRSTYYRRKVKIEDRYKFVLERIAEME